MFNDDVDELSKENLFLKKNSYHLQDTFGRRNGRKINAVKSGRKVGRKEGRTWKQIIRFVISSSYSLRYPTIWRTYLKTASSTKKWTNVYIYCFDPIHAKTTLFPLYEPMFILFIRNATASFFKHFDIIYRTFIIAFYFSRYLFYTITILRILYTCKLNCIPNLRENKKKKDTRLLHGEREREREKVAPRE